MTTHAAKGLEFDVVVLVDTGRERFARQAGDILVDAAGRVALRAPHPIDGSMQPRARLGRRRGRRGGRPGRGGAAAAVRRAHPRAAPPDRLGRARPGRGHDHRPDLQHAGRRPGRGGRHRGRHGAAAGARRAARARSRGASPEQAAEPEIGAQLELFSEGGRSVIALPALEPAPAAARGRRSRGSSYSALALYRRCGYRYFAQRVLGLPEPERERGAERRARPAGARRRRPSRAGAARRALERAPPLGHRPRTSS